MLKFLRIPFGQSGDRAAVPDAPAVGGNVSYTEGYGVDYSRPKTDPLSKNIEREKMNQIFFDVTTAIEELQSRGIPDFITTVLNGGSPFSYDQNAVVRYSDGNLYISLVAANTALPTDATKWARFDIILGHLGDGSDTAFGDALVAVKQPFADSVSRTQHDVNIDTGLYVENFRLPADPDDTLSIQRVLNLGRVALLRSNKTYTASGLTAVAGAGLVCSAGRATIQVPAGAGFTGIVIDKSNFILRGVNFDGGNLGPWNVAAPTAGTREGVIVGNPFGTGLQLHGIAVQDCDIFGFDHRGLHGREIQIGFEFGKRCVLENVNAYSNYINHEYSPRFEYVTTTNCFGYFGFVGIIMQGGNNSIAASHYEWNYYNCQLAAGENDAHGQFVACSFNHAVGVGLSANGITNGHLFIGCAFWYSSIELISCVGVMISRCQIAGGTPAITINGGGLNFIDENYTPNGLTKTFIGNVFTSFRGNRTSVADNSPASHYSDMYAQSVASTFAYPITWNATTDTVVPLTLATAKWQGEDAAFLSSGGGFYLPLAGFYEIIASIRFTVGSADEHVVMQVLQYRGATLIDSEISSAIFKASQTDGCVRLGTNFFCQAGDIFKVTFRTLTATGVTIPAAGIKVTVTSKG